MKFGKSWDEVQAEPASNGGGFMKYFKDGDTTFRILQEPSDWIGYWEHFNPNGFSFPCTQDRKTCPGCTSDVEKMKKASRKIAIQVLEGEYVNVYKFPKTLADKLSNRANRIGTITDRDYTISRFKSGDKVEYDIEGGDKIPVDISKLEFKDVEAMLEQSFNDSWGDSDKAQATRDGAAQAQGQSDLKAKLANQKFEEGKPEEMPDWAKGESKPEPKVWTEEELRALRLDEIIKVCLEEGVGEPPEDAKTTDAVVDWLLEQ